MTETMINTEMGMPSQRLSKTSAKLQHRHGGWLKGLPPYVTVPNTPLPAFIAVGGGKGGVGKSIISANISARLAKMGYRVLVIDLDLGCANLHTHFGVAMPSATLAEFVVHRRKRFAEVILPTGVNNVGLIAGGREESWGAFLENGPEALLSVWDSLLTSRSEFGVDFVVLDLGAGTHRNTMDFFSAANMGVITVLPEPTSIENAYVFMRTSLWRLLEHVAGRLGKLDVLGDVRQAFSQVGRSFEYGYAECLRQISDQHPELVAAMHEGLESRTMGLVVNQTRSQQDIDVGNSMEHICKQYFGFSASFLGHLNYDDAAWKSLRNRRLLINDFPHGVLSKRIGNVTLNAVRELGYMGG